MTAPLVVLHSLPGVRPTTNPYLVMLRDRLNARRDLRVLDFSYWTALTARYDVFHVHWPENLLGGATLLRRIARQVCLLAFLTRLSIQRIPIVRTLHNIERPEGLRWHEYVLLDWVDRLTKLRIHLNALTPHDPRRASVLIPHGHYRDWFADVPRPKSLPGRIGYAGLIRRYKGVETLILAFRAVPAPPEGPKVSLRVGGKPSTPEMAELLRELAAGDPRIELDLEFLTEAEFAGLVSRSELVVLPYRFMHNSGGALASLSLDRAILVPDNEVNRQLAEEVGPGWIHLFTGELDVDDLVRALTAIQSARRRDPDRRPDLSRRNWDAAAAAHAGAYRQVARRRGGLAGRRNHGRHGVAQRRHRTTP